MHKRLHEAARERDDRLLGDDRLEQITQRVIDRRRDDGDERFVDAAERLVDTPEQFGRKTRGKRRARLVEQRADGFEAEPAQRRAGFRRKPQRFDRAAAPALRLPARGQDSEGRGMKARQRPGRAGRVGDGKPRRQAEIFFQPRRKDRRAAFPRRRTDARRLRCRGKNRRRRSPRPRARRSAYSASPTAPGGAARRRRRRHRWRAPATIPLSRAHPPTARRARAPRPRPPRSRRRCAARRRR